MSYLRECEVVEVLPDRCGIRVRFKNLMSVGYGELNHVRVPQPRMHPSGGAALWLPEVGELGYCGETDGGTLVWLGAIPYLDKNQVDPTPGILYLRHQSGVTIQIRGNGDFEVSHPMGARITMAQSAGALPALQSSSLPAPISTVVPVMEIVHPSGASIQIDADGKGQIHGFASLILQDGGKRFVMEDFIGAFNNHNHSNGNGGAPTGLPITPVTVNATCSPVSFKGPGV